MPAAGDMIRAGSGRVEASRRRAYRRPMPHPTEGVQAAQKVAEEGAQAATDCPRCQKPLPLCICDSVTPIQSRLSLLILQHPQEQDRALGTARLTAQHFPDSVVKVGLSWPSLAKAVGRPIADPSRWAVLYLGSAKAAALDPGTEVVALNRKGELAENQRAVLARIEGVVLLDGTWSQAKALWWRNPWMLKCQRVILGPKHASAYGALRREPRRDGLSTLEAAAMLMGALERRPEIETTLKAAFERMLTRFREVQHSNPALAPRPKPRRQRDFRRRRKA